MKAYYVFQAGRRSRRIRVSGVVGAGAGVFCAVRRAIFFATPKRVVRGRHTQVDADGTVVSLFSHLEIWMWIWSTGRCVQPERMDWGGEDGDQQTEGQILRRIKLLALRRASRGGGGWGGLHESGLLGAAVVIGPRLFFLFFSPAWRRLSAGPLCCLAPQPRRGAFSRGPVFALWLSIFIFLPMRCEIS